MKGIQLSTFEPALNYKPGGIKVILSNKYVVPVAGSTKNISEQATLIHKWLMDTYAAEGAAIRVSCVILKFGRRTRKFSPTRDTMCIQGFPLEELQDASLLYVEEAK